MSLSSWDTVIVHLVNWLMWNFIPANNCGTGINSRHGVRSFNKANLITGHCKNSHQLEGFFFGCSLLEFGTAVLAAVTWQAWHVRPKKSLGMWSLPSVLSITPWIAQILGFHAAKPSEGCAEVGSERSAGSWAAGKTWERWRGNFTGVTGQEKQFTLMERFRWDVGKEFEKLWLLHP